MFQTFHFLVDVVVCFIWGKRLALRFAVLNQPAVFMHWLELPFAAVVCCNLKLLL